MKAHSELLVLLLIISTYTIKCADITCVASSLHSLHAEHFHHTLSSTEQCSSRHLNNYLSMKIYKNYKGKEGKRGSSAIFIMRIFSRLFLRAPVKEQTKGVLKWNTECQTLLPVTSGNCRILKVSIMHESHAL